MADILTQIVASKKNEVEEALKTVSISSLESTIEKNQFPNYSLAKALLKQPGIIAEFKRASPSKGVINNTHRPAEIVRGYDENGAVGISVLTDKSYFQARIDDFSIARKVTLKPLLRKEFIVDPYQLYQSKAMGADVILLIAAILTKEQIRDYSILAHALDLEVLIELHDHQEINKLSGMEDIIGVNNRNLKTFQVDIQQSIRIKKELGEVNRPLISESGLSDISQVEELLAEGFKGFLMGEYFMKQKEPIDAFQYFNQSLSKLID